MNENTLILTISPIEAANGVAKLSGFIFSLIDARTIAIKKKSGRKI